MTQQSALTELDAINEILAAVGQAPVTAIDTTTDLYRKVGDTYTPITVPTNPDVAMAQQVLLETSRKIQSEGWCFNREFAFDMTPNDDDEIIIPDTMLQCDASRDGVDNRMQYGGINTVRRNGKLYDKTAHSFKFDDVIPCDILWYFDWEDVPRPIQDLILKESAATFSMRIVGDPNLYQVLKGQAGECRAYALEYETTQGDYTFFGHPAGQDYYQSYKPFHALYR